MDRIDGVKEFISYKYSPGYKEPRLLFIFVCVAVSIVGSWLSYRSLEIAILCIINILLYVNYIVLFFKQKIENVFIFSFLRLGMLLVSFVTFMFAALRYINRPNTYEMIIVVSIWFIVAVARLGIIKYHISTGYYRGNKRFESNMLGTDIAVVGGPLAGIVFASFAKNYFDGVILVEVMTMVMGIMIIWNMTELIMLNYYVKKYDLVRKIRVM